MYFCIYLKDWYVFLYLFKRLVCISGWQFAISQDLQAIWCGDYLWGNVNVYKFAPGIT